MMNIQYEVTRLYLDQCCESDYYIGKTDAESAVLAYLACLGPNGHINVFGFVIPHTATVWYVVVNGDIIIGPSPSDLHSILDYRGITMPESLFLSCRCKLWLIDRPALDCHISTVLNEMSCLVNSDNIRVPEPL